MKRRSSVIEFRTVVGFVLLWAVLQGFASALNSTRGEWGLPVAALVLSAAFTVQWVLHREPGSTLGLSPPSQRGVLTAAVLSGVPLIAAASYILAQRADIGIAANAPWLLLGIFLQAGIAEELVFRGYLFGHIRRSHTFWRAALISAIPFAAVHLTLFLSMPWQVALVAVAMSVALSFPFAYLYELGGQTIWAPALLHAALQAVPKLIVIDDAAFPLLWMATGTALAWLVFLVPRETAPGRADQAVNA